MSYRKIRYHGTPAQDIELAEDNAPPLSPSPSPSHFPSPSPSPPLSPSPSPSPPSLPPLSPSPIIERNEAYGIVEHSQIEAPVYELMD